MLRGITPRRDRIARVMRFAVEHAHAAGQITALLVQSLLIPSTPVPRKLARLYVVSDVLHNSAAPLPNAWKYRQLLEEQLPVVFAHLGKVALSFPGRMKMEGFKMQINAVLETWEGWLIFPPATLETYRNLLNLQQTEDTAKITAPAVKENADDIDGEALDDAAAQVAQEDAEEELDGEALDDDDDDDDDLDGKAMDVEEEEEEEEEEEGEEVCQWAKQGRPRRWRGRHTLSRTSSCCRSAPQSSTACLATASESKCDTSVASALDCNNHTGREARTSVDWVCNSRERREGGDVRQTCGTRRGQSGIRRCRRRACRTSAGGVDG